MIKDEMINSDEICNQDADYEKKLKDNLKIHDYVINNCNLNLNSIKKIKEENNKLLDEYQSILSKHNVNLKDFVLFFIGSGLLVIPVWGNIISNMGVGILISLLTGTSVSLVNLVKENVEKSIETRKLKEKTFGRKNITDSEMIDEINKITKEITKLIDFYHRKIEEEKKKRQVCVDELNKIECKKKINLSTGIKIKDIVDSYTNDLDENKRKKFVDDLNEVYEHEMRNSYQKKYK